jgi:hypothetical protein
MKEQHNNDFQCFEMDCKEIITDVFFSIYVLCIQWAQDGYLKNASDGRFL